MIRLVLGDDGGLGVDLVGRAFGRGAWVHARSGCLARAANGGAAKSFKRSVATPAPVLIDAVRQAADRRIESLVASARGAGQTAAGSDVARAAFDSGRAELVVVATDGRAAAQASFVTSAVAAGKAIAWGTKERIGRATGRPDTAVVAILDKGFAGAILRASTLSSMPAPAAPHEVMDDGLVEIR